MDHFLQVLEKVPDADPFLPPDDYEQFGHIVAALTADQAPPARADQLVSG